MQECSKISIFPLHHIGTLYVFIYTRVTMLRSFFYTLSFILGAHFLMNLKRRGDYYYLHSFLSLPVYKLGFLLVSLAYPTLCRR